MQRLAGPPTRRVRGASAGALIAVAASLLAASPAAAHTDIEYSLPADQDEVEEPVSEITVAFSDPVTLVGVGFEVFTPQQVIVEPGVFTEDDRVFVLQLDVPLAGGAAGVRYEVVAADGHVLEGGFSFTVLATAPTAPSPPPPPPTGPATPPPAPATTLAPSADDDQGDDDDGGSNAGLIIGVGAALAAAAVAFVVLRSRASGAA